MAVNTTNNNNHLLIDFYVIILPCLYACYRNSLNEDSHNNSNNSNRQAINFKTGTKMCINNEQLYS